MAVGTPTTGSAASSPLSLSVPAGLAQNDIVVIVASIDASAATFTTPTGFTQLNQHSVTADGQRVAVWWKRQTSTPDSGSYSIAWSTGTDGAACAIPLTGRHATNPPVIGTVTDVNTSQTGTSNTVTATGVTAVVGDDVLHVSLPDVGSANIGNGHSAWSLGTEIVDIIDGATGWTNIGVAKAENVAAGATGNETVTLSKSPTGNTGWSTFLIRVPAGAQTVAKTGGGASAAAGGAGRAMLAAKASGGSAVGVGGGVKSVSSPGGAAKVGGASSAGSAGASKAAAVTKAGGGLSVAVSGGTSNLVGPAPAFPDVGTVIDDFVRGIYPSDIYSQEGATIWDTVPVLSGAGTWSVASASRAFSNGNGNEAVSLLTVGPDFVIAVQFDDPLSAYFALWPCARTAADDLAFPSSGIHSYALVHGLSGPGRLDLRSYGGGSAFLATAVASVAPVAGDWLAIRKVGSTIETWTKIAGENGGDWTMRQQATDTTWSHVGKIAMESGNGVFLRRMVGGTITAGGTTVTKDGGGVFGGVAGGPRVLAAAKPGGGVVVAAAAGARATAIARQGGAALVGIGGGARAVTLPAKVGGGLAASVAGGARASRPAKSGGGNGAGAAGGAKIEAIAKTGGAVAPAAGGAARATAAARAGGALAVAVGGGVKGLLAGAAKTGGGLSAAVAAASKTVRVAKSGDMRGVLQAVVNPVVTSLTGYGAYFGGGTNSGARSTADGYLEATAVMEAAGSAQGAAGITYGAAAAQAMGVLPGDTVFVRSAFKIVSAPVGANTLQLRARYLRPDGTYLNELTVQTINAPTTGQWYDMSGNHVAPAGAGYCGIYVLASFTGTQNPVTIRATRLQIAMTSTQPAFFIRGAAGGGARATAMAKVGGSLAVAMAGGSRLAALLRSAGGVSAGAGGGGAVRSQSKTGGAVSAAAASASRLIGAVRGGGGFLAAAGGGDEGHASGKLGGASAASSGGGPRAIAIPAKFGGALAAGAGGGTRAVLRTKAGGALAALAAAASRLTGAARAGGGASSAAGGGDEAHTTGKQGGGVSAASAGAVRVIRRVTVGGALSAAQGGAAYVLRTVRTGGAVAAAVAGASRAAQRSAVGGGTGAGSAGGTSSTRATKSGTGSARVDGGGVRALAQRTTGGGTVSATAGGARMVLLARDGGAAAAITSDGVRLVFVARLGGGVATLSGGNLLALTPITHGTLAALIARRRAVAEVHVHWSAVDVTRMRGHAIITPSGTGARVAVIDATADVA